jgi:hypothetical protein
MRKFFVLCILLCVTACTSTPNAVAPTFAPFPTMTAGQEIFGALPTPANPVPIGELANPATAIALSSQMTPTPNRAACPVLDGTAVLLRRPTDTDAAIQSIVNYLQDGGSITELREAVRVRWDGFGQSGFIRDDLDLTGEGATDIVMSFKTPQDIGMFLIIGCNNGQYQVYYQFITEEENIPRLVTLLDINNQIPAEVIFAVQECFSAEDCQFEIQVLGWDGLRGRFNNLLDTPLNVIDIPEIRDIDNDLVAEIVVNLRTRGNSETGPLRTGVNIYDWNGSVYTLSIVQLEPPRYYIQIVQQGDESFSQENWENAIQTYNLVVDNEDYRYWFNDEATWLESYALYRMLISFAILGDARFSDIALKINTDYPITAETPVEDLPVYVVMSYRFIDSMTVFADLHRACRDVLAIVDERPEALELLNRYGSRSPTYGELDLCPF